MFGSFHWFVKVLIFIGVCFGYICLMKICEKYDTQIMRAVKKILSFIAEMSEDALLVILAMLAR